MLFDIQVNGAFGVDFNDDALTLDDFRVACSSLLASGVERFFPTIITAPIEQMGARLARIVSFVEQEPSILPLIAGLHVEGPFISNLPGYRGTHPESAIMNADRDVAKRLLDCGGGLIKLLTLSPETDRDFETTTYLANQNIIVFAGHSDAPFDCLRAAIDHGLRGYTHLGNGCALEVNRHDNIISRVLALREKLMVSLIADGIHLPFWLLKSFVDIIGENNVIITSDSMSAAGMPPGEYWISGQPIIVDANRRTRHRDHNYLAGSASTLQEMKLQCHRWLPPNSESVDRLFRQNAAKLFDVA